MTRARAIQIGRRRAQVLVHAPRPDPQVRLAVVAEHDDVGGRAVGQLELVAEVDDANGDARDPGRDRPEAREVVGRARARSGVRGRRAPRRGRPPRARAPRRRTAVPARRPTRAARPPPCARPRRHATGAVSRSTRQSATRRRSTRVEAAASYARPHETPAATGCAEIARRIVGARRWHRRRGSPRPGFGARRARRRAPPGRRPTVPNSPKQLDLTFSENVEVSLGSIQLFNQKGDRVDIGAPHHSRRPPTTRSRRACPHLDNGGYVVTWQVISADSHPVHGAFTFTVGRSSANAEALAARLEAKAGGQQDRRRALRDRARAASTPVSRCCSAASCSRRAIRPHGRRRSRADALVWIGWGMLFVVDHRGGDAAGSVRGARCRCRDVVPRRGHRARCCTHATGTIAELRLVLLLLALPLLLMVRKTWRPPRVVVGARRADRRSRSPRRPGSPATRPPARSPTSAVPLDTLHVARDGVWLGGLASLALIVLDRDPDARRTADRFSPVALLERGASSSRPACSRRGGRSAGRVDAFLDTTLRPPPAREDRGLHRSPRARPHGAGASCAPADRRR